MPARPRKAPKTEIEPVETKPTLVLRFDSEQAFRTEFAQNLGVGALFVPSSDSHATGKSVDVKLLLPFCESELVLSGEVVARVAAPVAELGAGAAGISVRLTESPRDLRQRVMEHTGLDLHPEVSAAGARRRNSERFDTDADIVISTAEGEFSGHTANLSYAGVLALIPVQSLAVGSEVRIRLSTPMVELDLRVDGKIIHVQRCDGGVKAHGIQLHYPAERIDEVMAFIEFLQSFDRARRLALVAGDLDASGLGSTLEMFVRTAPDGTLVVHRGNETGKIVFAETFILHCAVGMVTGVKALARLARWTSGRFEFHPVLQLPETPDEPQPFDAAMMMASVQLDEMARIGFDTFQPNDTFVTGATRPGVSPETLTELEREVFDYAREGFNVGAISDMIPAADADIFKALVVLVDVGVIARRR